MKRRFYVARDYYAALSDGEFDWGVYDRASKDPDARPLAVFAKRVDAATWASQRNSK